MDKLRVIGRDFEATPAIQAYIHERVTGALTGHAQHVADFCVRLGDLNGPRGGIDKYCSVTIQLHGLPDVYVQAENADLYVAINNAVRRAVLAARRTIEKSQRIVRSTP